MAFGGGSSSQASPPLLTCIASCRNLVSRLGIKPLSHIPTAGFMASWQGPLSLRLLASVGWAHTLPGASLAL